MLRNCFIIILLVTLFSSCTTYSTMVNANDNIKAVTLGMSKEEVIAIMGSSYRMSGLSMTDDGAQKESIWYPATQGSIFYFTFKGDKLIEWHEKFINNNIERYDTPEASN